MKTTEDIRDALELAVRTLKNAAQEAAARLVEQEKEIERLRAATRPYTREQLLNTPLAWSRTYEGPARPFNLGEACYRAWDKPAYKQAEDAAVALYWEHRERQAQAQLIAAGRENEIPYIADTHLEKVRNEDGWRFLTKNETILATDETYCSRVNSPSFGWRTVGFTVGSTPGLVGCNTYRRRIPAPTKKSATPGDGYRWVLQDERLEATDETWAGSYWRPVLTCVVGGGAYSPSAFRRKVEVAMPLIGAGYRALKTGEQVLEGDENYIGAGVWSPCTIHYSVCAQLGYFVPSFGEGFYHRRVDDPFIPERFQGLQGFFNPNYRVLGKGEVVQAGDEYCHPVAAGLGWFPIGGLSWCIGRHVGEVVRDAWRRKK